MFLIQIMFTKIILFQPWRYSCMLVYTLKKFPSGCIQVFICTCVHIYQLAIHNYYLSKFPSEVLVTSLSSTHIRIPSLVSKQALFTHSHQEMSYLTLRVARATNFPEIYLSKGRYYRFEWGQEFLISEILLYSLPFLFISV